MEPNCWWNPCTFELSLSTISSTVTYDLAFACNFKKYEAGTPRQFKRMMSYRLTYPWLKVAQRMMSRVSDLDGYLIWLFLRST